MIVILFVVSYGTFRPLWPLSHQTFVSLSLSVFLHGYWPSSIIKKQQVLFYVCCKYLSFFIRVNCFYKFFCIPKTPPGGMTSILNHPACIFLGKVNSCPPEDKSRATCPICASYRISFKHSFFNLLIEWRSDAHPVHKYAIGMNKKFEQACFSECWTFFFVCHVYSNVFYSIETEKNALEFSCSEVKGFLIVSRFTLKGTLDYTFWRKYS